MVDVLKTIKILVGAGPDKWVHQKPGITLEFKAFEEYDQPVYITQLVMIGIPEATTRVATPQREEANIIHSVPGEPSKKAKISASGTLSCPVSLSRNGSISSQRP